jgi:uncharacterized protein (TIGR00297 family)
MNLPSFSAIFLFFPLLLLFMIVCIQTGKLTLKAAMAAGLTGLFVFLGARYTGISLLGIFFLLGTLATGHQKKKKAIVDPTGQHPEKRTAGQVFANGGVAALLALPIIFDIADSRICIMMMAASLASATADTLSSELGTVYGKNFYNILTFKKDLRGLDGVISMEGTLAGAAGALVIASVHAAWCGFNGMFICIFLAGLLGNLADSILGATLERRRYISNDVVNFSNTLFAALAGGLLYLLF